MKVALMLHGQARNFEIAYNTHKKFLLDKYDVDVYCHLVWDQTIKNRGFYVGRRNNYPVISNLPEKIKKYYNPKKIKKTRDYPINGQVADELFDRYPKLKKYITEGGIYDIFFTFLQFKGIMEVSDLFDWKNYDFIVKSRYDSSFITFPDLTKLDKNKIFFGQDNHNTLIHKNDWFIDLSYIMGNSFCNFTKIFEYLQNDDFPVPPFPAELVYNYYLHKMNFIDKIVKLPHSEFTLDFHS